MHFLLKDTTGNHLTKVLQIAIHINYMNTFVDGYLHHLIAAKLRSYQDIIQQSAWATLHRGYIPTVCPTEGEITFQSHLNLSWQRTTSAFCLRSQRAPSECQKSQSAWIRRTYVSRHLCNLAKISFTRDRDLLDNAGSIPRRFRRNPIERTSRGLETINHDGPI